MPDISSWIIYPALCEKKNLLRFFPMGFHFGREQEVSLIPFNKGKGGNLIHLLTLFMFGTLFNFPRFNQFRQTKIAYFSLATNEMNMLLRSFGIFTQNVIYLMKWSWYESEIKRYFPSNDVPFVCWEKVYQSNQRLGKEQRNKKKKKKKYSTAKKMAKKYVYYAEQ